MKRKTIIRTLTEVTRLTSPLGFLVDSSKLMCPEWNSWSSSSPPQSLLSPRACPLRCRQLPTARAKPSASSCFLSPLHLVVRLSHQLRLLKKLSGIRPLSPAPLPPSCSSISNILLRLQVPPPPPRSPCSLLSGLHPERWCDNKSLS